MAQPYHFSDRLQVAQRLQDEADEQDWVGNYAQADALRQRAARQIKLSQTDGQWEPNF